MDLFSISQLSRFSGIQAHTIRMWEKRYNTLKPERSEGNTRYYDGRQLKRLLNIVSLMKADYKVSELSALGDQKLSGLVSTQLNSKKEEGYVEYCISQLIASSVTYDEAGFDKMFSHCLLRFGMEGTYTNVLYPMLDRVGLLWCGDVLTPAREHFLANLVRQKLFTAIDALPNPHHSSTWILFLPEDEFHEVGLLFGHYLLKAAGCKSVYLGPNVPLGALRNAVSEINPGQLLLFMVHNEDPGVAQAYLNQVRSFFKKEIYIAGHQELVGGLELAVKTKWLKNSGQLKEALDLYCFNYEQKI